MKIQVLPEHVANQIAAGEVVERPASVVRELVDNAIDAGASQVIISLRGGGISSLTVTDNGAGMQKEDAIMAFKRHATSKISALTDLDTLTTRGFRGEALPSIASVSMVRVRTKAAEATTGIEFSLRAGEPSSVATIGAPQGTEIEVSNLFFNTPARKKFQKSQRSEEMRIKQWLLHYVMGAPEVHFRLLFDDREVLNIPARPSLVERAKSLLKGSSVAVDLSVNGVHVEGVLAHPAQAHGEAHALAVLVNKRLISDRMILRAAKDGFGSSLKDREFPVGVLNIGMDPRLVDINVHPQKSEVRFKDSSQVYVAVLRAVQAAVADFKAPFQGLSPARAPMGHASGGVSRGERGFSSSSGAPTSFYAPARSGTLGLGNAALAEQGAVSYAHALQVEENKPLAAVPRANVDPEAAPETGGAEFRFQELSYIGQVLECYLLCQWNPGGAAPRLVVVDMHAAHERYNYNVVRRALKERKSTAQRLLVPLEFEVSEQSALRLEEHEPLLTSIGFEFEVSPSGAVKVQQVPSLLVHRNVQETLRKIAMIEADEGGGSAAYEYLVDQIAARIACHASIRSGKRMSREEAESLFALMDSSACSAACPHGRPVVVSFAEEDIERWFGRDR